MGFGDPYHKHPLREALVPCDGRVDCFHSVLPSGRTTNCFQCELPISSDTCCSCYGCTICDYYIHKLCQDLPKAMTHPLHDQHPLTLFQPLLSFNESSTYLCNVCQNPCLGRFAYHCPPCQIFLHLKCLFTLKHEKHEHSLILAKRILGLPHDCKICGYPVSEFFLGCSRCEFYIHYECSLIPLMVKRHHVHELTLRHHFPGECDQVYCDLCEDKDGEMDRKLSYYYCKACDYIAHVHCCITQPIEDALVHQRFTHEHNLGLERTTGNLCCSQCNYTVDSGDLEYPSLIKHSRYPEHTLIVDPIEYDAVCKECPFTIDFDEAFTLTHPLWRNNLEIDCKNSLFRCDACGELGKGSRVADVSLFNVGKFDLHLECFALPGKLEHESHPLHPLYLRWLKNKSVSRYCSVCTKEVDPQLWFYFCHECDYSAHLDCVASDLLTTLRSSIKNQPDFCAIIEPDKTLFEYQIADSRRASPLPSYDYEPPVLIVRSDDDDDNGGGVGEEKQYMGIETVDDVLRCPKCYILISTQARYSTLIDWLSSQVDNFHNNNVTSANDQTPSEMEPLSFLDEQTIDELNCSICNKLIFPPTYSCLSCHIFFHKSCAELPRKILYNETTYTLMAPPFLEGLTNCSHCYFPISGWAYLSSCARFIFGVHCASGAPSVIRTYHKSYLFSKQCDNILLECIACKGLLGVGTIMIASADTKFGLHLECGLLPPVIKHRIHQHPLELATDLAELYDEYICDVCEKDLNPNLWAYRCVDSCGIWATSHVTCVITSKRKCHFRYDQECQNMTEEQKLEFRRKVKEQGSKA